MDGQLTILIAEPLNLVRAALRALLEEVDGIAVVGEAGDWAETVRMVARQRPDVLLLEPGMQNPPPEWVLANATAVHPALKVLVLASPQDVSVAIAFLEAGAAGCILKSDQPEELWRALRTVAAGELAVSRAVALHLLEGQAGPSPRAVDVLLTEREEEVYHLLAAGLSNKEIAQKLYLSVRAVEVHLCNLCSKLGVRSRLEAVTQAVGHADPSAASRRN